MVVAQPDGPLDRPAVRDHFDRQVAQVGARPGAAVREPADGAPGGLDPGGAYARSPWKALNPITKTSTDCAVISLSKGKSTLLARPALRPRINVCWLLQSNARDFWPSCRMHPITALTRVCVLVASRLA